MRCADVRASCSGRCGGAGACVRACERASERASVRARLGGGRLLLELLLLFRCDLCRGLRVVEVLGGVANHLLRLLQLLVGVLEQAALSRAALGGE